ELVEARQRGFDRGCGVDRAQRFADRPQCAFDAYRRLARTKWTTHSCTVACGQISLIDSGSPLSPSQATIITSATPRLRSSARQLIQCLAPSPPVPTHIPSTSRSPARLIPTATYTGRLATCPSRIFTCSASISTTGYTASSGRDCQAASSSTTLSVTRLTRSR